MAITKRELEAQARQYFSRLLYLVLLGNGIALAGTLGFAGTNLSNKQPLLALIVVVANAATNFFYGFIASGVAYLFLVGAYLYELNFNKSFLRALGSRWKWLVCLYLLYVVVAVLGLAMGITFLLSGLGSIIDGLQNLAGTV